MLAAEMGFAPSALSNAMQKTQTPQGKSGFLSEIGLAWQIDTDVIWHNGGTGGYRSYMGFTKDKSLGVVVLANAANDVDDIGQYILGDRDSVDDTPKRSVAKIDYNIYDHYTGRQIPMFLESGVLLCHHPRRQPADGQIGGPTRL